MTTKSEVENEVRESDYDGIPLWYASGHAEKKWFLGSVVDRYPESIEALVRAGRNIPVVNDVEHATGMAAECQDGIWVQPEFHDEFCDYEDCDYDPKKCYPMTILNSESLLPSSPNKTE